MGCATSKKSVGAIRDADCGISANSRNEFKKTFKPVTGVIGGETIQPEIAPKHEAARTSEEKAVLKITSVNLNVEENTSNHRTDNYQLTEQGSSGEQGLLVIRRGQAFDITITFHRAFDADSDDIKLVFIFGKPHRYHRGSHVSFYLSDPDGNDQWAAKIVQQDDALLVLRIAAPPSAPVGEWNMCVDTMLKGTDLSGYLRERVFRYSEKYSIIMICNPWCKDDTTYMDDELLRREYVVNDTGRLFKGSARQIFAKPWNYGQYEDFILPCAMYLLEDLPMRLRGNPVMITRHLSSKVNSCDNDGVLIGKWDSGGYDDGHPPTYWSGSVAILDEYWSTKEPVKYGQCWVFSGLLVTLCRTLGIACRSITNFDSAHDTDGSLTIDCYWDAKGHPVNGGDSIWNFHVWNDVWMARPDLPPGFGGWQVIDATPQERSEGLYCCGPASVEAMKNGVVSLPYDGPFVFSEINADRLHWLAREDEGHVLVAKETLVVGKRLCTKSPSSEGKMMVTNMYKYPEGSQEERTAVWRAVKDGSSRQDAYVIEAKDVEFKLQQKDDIMIGQPFEVLLIMKNQSDEIRTVKITLSATVVYYTGIIAELVKSVAHQVTIPPNEENTTAMSVLPLDYMAKLVDMSMFKITCMARVEETSQFYCSSDDFRLLKPTIHIECLNEVHQGTKIEVELSLVNPLNTTLTRPIFTVEGAGLQRTLVIKPLEVIAPYEEAKVTAHIKASRLGRREIIASFDCKELIDIVGSRMINVVPSH